MKLTIRQGPGPVIKTDDEILFHPGAVVVAKAARGNFDSTPYEPRHDAWSYTAELHRLDGRLWVIVVEVETVSTVRDGDWVRTRDERVTCVVSDDDGATWNAAGAPQTGDQEPLSRVASS